MSIEPPGVRRIVLVLAVLMAGLSAGCATRASKAGGYYLDDGPGKVDPRRLARLMKTPDPVPVPEKLRARANRPYTVMGQHFVPMTERRPYRQQGVASWYGQRFHGKPTALGETYDMYGMTAAHPTLPLPSYVRVRNLENGRSVVVRVNDRGPFLRGRLIDLSFLAASKLDYVKQGHARVEVELLDPGAGTKPPPRQPVARQRAAALAASVSAAAPLVSGAEAANDASKRLQTLSGKTRRADAGGMRAPADDAGQAVDTAGEKTRDKTGDKAADRATGKAEEKAERMDAPLTPQVPASHDAGQGSARPAVAVQAGDGAAASPVRFGPARQRTVNGQLVFEGWGAEHEDPEPVRRIDLGADAPVSAGAHAGGKGGAEAAGPGPLPAGQVSASPQEEGRNAARTRAQANLRTTIRPQEGPGAGWYLQLGVFRQMENALRVQREQQANGQAGDPPVDVAQRNDRYVVQLGPYASEAEARASAAAIAGRTGQHPPIRKR